MKLFNEYYNKYKRKGLLILKEEVYNTIIDVALKSLDVETGGILMGYDKDFYTVEVTHVSLPGPNAIRTKTKFLRDTKYCEKVLKENYNKYGVDYVGEWHSHVVNLGELSSGDILTLTAIMMDPDYNFNSFAKILAIVKDSQVYLKGYIISEKNLLLPAKIQVI